MNLKRFTAFVLCLLMLVTCLFPLTSCKDDEDPDKDNDKGGETCTEHTDENNDGKCDNCDAAVDTVPDGQITTYTVSVKSEGGLPFADVFIMILKDGVPVQGAYKQTNDNGIVTFELPKASGYSAQILTADSIPEGYTIEENYAFGATGVSIKLRSEIITSDRMPSVHAGYKLGDVIHDFTITDVNGVSYKLSDILGIGEGKKQMVMLNFWFSTCGPCISEFPYVNDNTVKFLEDAMVFAINDNNEDKLSEYSGATLAEKVQDFATSESGHFRDDPLVMPLFKYDSSTKDVPTAKLFQAPSSEKAVYYPTTVVIDRYGVIAFMHAGSITSESAWYKMFSHFTAEKYEQILVTDYAQLNPPQIPTSKWEGSDKIAEVFNKKDNGITVTFSPETGKDEEYAWHFNTSTYGEGTNAVPCIRPMNSGIENSFAIMKAEVTLKPGQAVAFDYISSTQSGADILYILVDGKDIYGISGSDTNPSWKECCAYVDPRPVTEANKDQTATYTISFVYQKDTSVNAGDDTVYLKDLRVIGVDSITAETHIFRYAASDRNKYGNGFNTYVTPVLGSDGYYHVGNANGPLILVNHLGYTLFDPEDFISNRLSKAGNELMLNGVNVYNTWLAYGSCAANSDLQGLTPVTEELMNILQEYTKKYASDCGFTYDDNLWLSLCVYYDAYGYDENGDPAKQLEDPIKGLATFSAFELGFTPENNGDKLTYEVTYNKVIMPRGLLYKFVPTVSGVYRINSHSATEVIGWVFVGTSQEWTVNQNERTTLTHFELEERLCKDLLHDNGQGTLVYDNNNVSLVAYMEAGKSYYIDIAYYDMYEYGSFDVDLIYEGESKNDYFVMASPGPLTYIETSGGGISQPIAVGIDYALHSDGYMHHVIERDENGNVTKWGNVIYADFSLPTTFFTSQSIEQLIKINAFNFAIDELDREALVILESIRLDGKKAIIDQWIAADTSDKTADEKKEAAEAKWNDGGYNDIVDDLIFDPENNGSYDADKLAIAEQAKKIGEIALMKTWAVANDALEISELLWKNNSMDTVALDPDASGVTAAQKELYNKAKTEFDAQWAAYRMNDVIMGIYHATASYTDRDLKALEYAEIYKNGGKDALSEQWSIDFDYLTSIPSGYADRYAYLWSFYSMDDVLDPDFIGHGTIKDYTERMEYYASLMEPSDNYASQGCVAVTKELMEILDVTVGKYVFDNALHGWLKFCFYYNDLGPVSE